MSSDSFLRIVAQLDQAPTSIETWESYDVDAMRALPAAERAELERLLLARLAQVEDGRVPPALVALGSRAAIEPLRDASRRYQGMALARVLRALWDLARDEDAARALAQLALSPDAHTRAFATSLAGDVDHPATASLLVDRLLSEDLAVRSEALSALMRKLKLDPYWKDKRKLLGRLVMGLYTPLMVVWRPACAQLAARLGAIAAGATPESQGFDLDPTPRSPEFLRFQTSIHAHPAIPSPWQDALDIDAGKQLQGEEALWAGAILAHALGQGDMRAAVAIAELGYHDLLPALREQALRTPTVPPSLAGAIQTLATGAPRP
jgi:hypothetical protein